MLDIIESTKNKEQEGIIISCDFLKAFDKINWHSLIGAMRYFKFSEVLISWTQIIYTEFQVKIQNNGFLSRPVTVEQGLHQGGPCSSLYFLVIAELLAILLRDNKKIEGIHIESVLNLLNQFADDLDVFSTANKESINEVFRTLDYYYTKTGLQINYDKTTIYRIGSLRNAKAQMYTHGVKWSNEDINVLGVCITHEDLLDKNYTSLLSKSKAILNSWTNRGLSLFGKITVINTLVASLFVYRMTVLPAIPQKFIKQFETQATNYIWSGKNSKIALKSLQACKTIGGAGLVNIKYKDMSLKISWIQILDKECEYAKMVYSQIHKVGSWIWRCNLHPNDIHLVKVQSTFWVDVLHAWSEFSYFRQNPVLNQIIWLNSRIRINNTPIFWEDCWNKGLVYIYQLYDKGKIKPVIKLINEYGLDTMRINSLITAIPRDWKKSFQANEVILPIVPHFSL